MEKKTNGHRNSFLNKFKQFDKQELDINCFTAQLKDYGKVSKKKLNEILNESSKIFRTLFLNRQLAKYVEASFTIKNSWGYTWTIL